MRNKKRNCYKKSPCVIITVYIILFLIVVFLSLPLIFQEETASWQISKSKAQALPLKTENPFTNYLKLLRNFYTPSKQKKAFTRVNNPLLAKNTAKQETFAQQQEQDQTTYIEEKEQAVPNYYNYDNVEIPFFEPPQEPKNNLVEQENFIPIPMEGLYETSQTDPYEVRQAARRTLFDIFSPRRRLALLNQPGSSQSIFVKNSTIQDDKQNIAATQTGTENYSFPLTMAYAPLQAKNSYDYGFLDSFNRNQQLLEPLHLSGLSFEDQVNLVAGRLNIIRRNNYRQNSSDNNNGRDNPNPKPPLPLKDTFDPNKWEKKLSTSCHKSDGNDSIEKAEEKQNDKITKDSNQKIDICDPEINKKLTKIDSKMQEGYNYLMVSGRYKNKIMIPAASSLPIILLTTSISSDEDGIYTLNLPKELRGKQLSKNTEKTEFEFVSALKPQVFEQIMKDEKTILLSVDEEDAKRFPTKTILIQSGEIETYQGANKIIGDINKFPSMQEKLKQEFQKQAQLEKEQKVQSLNDKLTSVM